MKVWVIMGNDFPDAVLESEEAADKYINHKKELTKRKMEILGGSMIYWRSYEFEVQQ